ncbi:hypothetical protein Btru_037320, partial [Bulinus truncatus]
LNWKSICNKTRTINDCFEQFEAHCEIVPEERITKSRHNVQRLLCSEDAISEKKKACDVLEQCSKLRNVIDEMPSGYLQHLSNKAEYNKICEKEVRPNVVCLTKINVNLCPNKTLIPWYTRRIHLIRSLCSDEAKSAIEKLPYSNCSLVESLSLSAAVHDADKCSFNRTTMAVCQELQS